MKYKALVVGALLALGGCGGSGVEAPEQFEGVWSADCSTPFVKFDGSKIHVYPDNATYDLTKATLEGPNLEVAYKTPQGDISETYVVEGDTLRLDHGTYGGQQATWHKQPMRKCG